MCFLFPGPPLPIVSQLFLSGLFRNQKFRIRVRVTQIHKTYAQMKMAVLSLSSQAFSVPSRHVWAVLSNFQLNINLMGLFGSEIDDAPKNVCSALRVTIYLLSSRIDPNRR